MWYTQRAHVCTCAEIEKEREMRHLFFGIATAFLFVAGSSYAIAEDQTPANPAVEEQAPAVSPYCEKISQAITVVTNATSFDEITAAMGSTGVFDSNNMPTFDQFDNDLERARSDALGALVYAQERLSCQ